MIWRSSLTSRPRTVAASATRTGVTSRALRTDERSAAWGDPSIERVRCGGRRQVAEERGVEHGDVRYVGKEVAGDADAGKVGGVVEGGERRQPVNRGDHLGIDQRRRRRSARHP